MSRVARIVVPGYPHHVVQRGHNRQPLFHEPADYEAYLANLRELRTGFRVQVHAFCLMPNHVHLLLQPEDAEGLAPLMKRLAGRYAARYNRRSGRRGAVWESRYYSSLVAREAYHLACCRYIELNPVHAGIAADPAEHPWSSCRLRAGGQASPWLDPDPVYLALGATASERWDAWRSFLVQGIPDDERRLIREAVSRNQLTGDDGFARAVAASVGRLVPQRGRGRPKKK